MLGRVDWDIWYVLKCEGFHFGLSALAGFLGAWLTLTILLHSGLMAKLPGRCIYLLLLLAALSFAVLSHVAEDYILNWF
jgi:hypothetical protein